MVEEIILQSSSPAALPQPPIGKARKLSAECKGSVQASKSTLIYRLFNNQFIEIQRRNAKTSDEQKIIFSAGFLSKTVKTRINLQWLWLYTFVASLMATFVCHFALEQDYFAMATGAFALLALILFSASLQRCSVFYSEHARAPLMILPHAKNSATEINSMVHLVSEARKNHPLSKYVNQLAEETKLLREFHEKGFFSEKEYLEFRDRIFKKYPRK